MKDGSPSIAFAEDSAELPPDSDALTGAVTKPLAAKPGIECVAIVGAIAAGEPGPGRATAKNLRDLLGAHGVSLTRLPHHWRDREGLRQWLALPNPIRLSGSRRP